MANRSFQNMKSYRNHVLCFFILIFLILISSCSREIGHSSLNVNSKILEYDKTKYIENDSLLNIDSFFNLEADLLDTNVFYLDTVIAKTSNEFIESIQSNRVIQLENINYSFSTSSNNFPLKIEGVKNLKIIGTPGSNFVAEGKSNCVLQVANAYNIHIDNIVLGQESDTTRFCNYGKLKIEHAYNVTVENTKILGGGSIGLVTKDINNFVFKNSEITQCDILIFELDKSKRCRFVDSKFYNNHLGASVLGGFTNGSQNVTFDNCEFVNNIPKNAGNPAFNFFENYKNSEDQILFINSTFRNNNGFKWYGEKIKLEKCKIDSSDFIGLSGLNK